MASVASVPATPAGASTSRFQVDNVDRKKSGASAAAVGLSESETAPAEINISPAKRGVTWNTDTIHGEEGREQQPTAGMFDQHHGNQLTIAGDHKHQETLEPAPNLDFYRHSASLHASKRPTLAQLHEEDIGTKMEASGDLVVQSSDLVKDQDSEDEEVEEKFVQFDAAAVPNSTAVNGTAKPEPAPIKFGWIKGVFVRCVLNILGVMLYLRISWCTGQAGILLAICIVLFSSVVTTLTTFSMCAIVTNGEMKGGGLYFMISRSLGPEFGGSIGVIFSFANAVGAAMYIVGFAETVRDMLLENGLSIVDGDLNDVRIIGIATCCVLMGICFIGAGFEAKIQLGLLGILAVSLANYYVGVAIPSTTGQQLRGIFTPSGHVIYENLFPAFRDGHNFFSVFSIFFPAATGIMAGANISGDLKEPSSAIPKGTLSAIVVTTIIYVSAVFLTGMTTLRDASGLPADLDMRFNQTDVPWFEWQPSCTVNETCKYGLMNSAQVVEFGSAWAPLITAGIFAATLSSALASLVSAPKVFQAVCRDRLYPYVSAFGRGFGRDDEPRLGYVLSFAISILIILIGDLNAIAPLISNFFLASYGLINYACFDASFSGQPGFRPAFRYYNMWVSLLASVLCIAIMFVISWWTALLTFGCIAVLFAYLRYRKPDVSWGGSQQAHSYKDALRGLYQLSSAREHVKNYRPQILVLSGNPVARPSLVDFAANITKDNSLLICGHVFCYPISDEVVRASQRMCKSIPSWLARRGVNAFYMPNINQDLRVGVHSLLQNAGLGRMRPNILLMGYKNSWLKCSGREVQDYFNIVHNAFDLDLALGILRLPHGLDVSNLMREHHVGALAALDWQDPSKIAVDKAQVLITNPLAEDHFGTHHKSAQLSKKSVIGIYDKQKQQQQQRASAEPEDHDLGQGDWQEWQDQEDTILDTIELSEDEDAQPESPRAVEAQRMNDVPPKLSLYRGRHLTVDQRSLIASINQFHRPVKNAVVDVWWLYDDGGLALLLPHLLTLPGSHLQDARLRVFAVSSGRGGLELEQRSMATMLSKFRIDFADVMVIPDLAHKPSQKILNEFYSLIGPLRDESVEAERRITDDDLRRFKQKTYRVLRTRQLLFEHSRDTAQLIVMSIPVPRKGGCSASLYMSWLEMLSGGMPPMLMLRGNQQSVLTFQL